MTVELTGFIGLAALMMGLFAWMRLDMGRMEARIADRFDRVETRLAAVEGRVAAVEDRLTAVEGRLTAVEDRLTGVEGRLTAAEGRFAAVELGRAKLEGLLEGLREAVAVRAAAD